MTETELKKLNKGELVALAAELGLAPEGKRSELVARILEHESSTRAGGGNGGGNGGGPRGLISVKAVPVQCPACGGHKRKIIRSARRPKKGAWFQGHWRKGIVEQTAECVNCGHRYRLVDVIKTEVPEPADK